jgi:predicted DNA-binding protein (MmcQ/YjbR family)
MYAVLALDGATDRFSFKCTPERFEQLLERDGVVPAPYMARNKWVSLTRFDAVEGEELREAIREAYGLVLAKLPKRVRESLT